MPCPFTLVFLKIKNKIKSFFTFAYHFMPFFTQITTWTWTSLFCVLFFFPTFWIIILFLALNIGTAHLKPWYEGIIKEIYYYLYYDFDFLFHYFIYAIVNDEYLNLHHLHYTWFECIRNCIEDLSYRSLTSWYFFTTSSYKYVIYLKL